VCNSKGDPTSLVLSAVAIVIAVQTAVIILVMLVVAYKCSGKKGASNWKAALKGPDASIPVEMEESLYEAVDSGENIVTQKKPMHLK
jgi:hypothetical protein